MDGKDGKDGRRAPASRDERLKAALKANLARRKAQSRARQASDQIDESSEKKD